MNKLRKLLIPLILTFTLLFTGCSEILEIIEEVPETEVETAVETLGETIVETEDTADTEVVAETEVIETESIETEAVIIETEYVIDQDGVYTTAEDVALYLHTYGVLPGNFITKNEARALGWEGGSLEEFAPGMCIGGDHFGNYEGVLPTDRSYNECDINTLGASSRGAERLVYSTDGYIYYTGDHYETFEILYEGT